MKSPRSCVIIAFACILSGGRHAHADIIDFSVAHDGMMDGEPISFAMDGIFNTQTGEYAGSYAIGGIARRELPKIKRWIPKKGWWFKYLLELSELDGQSIYEFSGLDIVDSSSTAFSWGDIVNSEETVTGDATSVNMVGTFNVVTDGPGPDDADLAVSTSTILSDGTFMTEFSWVDGESADTVGTSSLALPVDLQLSLFMDVTPIGDGSIGTFSGLVTPAPGALALLGLSGLLCGRTRG